MTKSVFSEEYGLFLQQVIEARRSAGLTQTELAKKLGRPQSFVSKYERGERRLDVVEFIRIAGSLGIDASKLVKDLSESAARDKGAQ